MKNVIYRIENSNGLTGGAWSQTYETREEAGEALRQAMGWTGLVFSPAFTASESSTGYEAYETQAECDALDDGDPYAPRVIKTSVEA